MTVPEPGTALDPAEAIALLPPPPYPIHVWAGGMGADWGRDEAIEAIARSPERHVVSSWLGPMLRFLEGGKVRLADLA